MNIWFRKLAPRGELPKMDLEDENATFGLKTLQDLGWKDVLDGFTCTECGRCQEACPAYNTGKPLNPKTFIMGIRDMSEMAEQTIDIIPNSPIVRETYGLDDTTLSPAAMSTPIVDTAIPYDAVWDCVTCGACVEACPVLIEHVDKIVGLRRNLVLEESRFPSELTGAFRAMESQGNPWGQPSSARLDWTKPLPFEVPTVADMAAAGRLDELEVLYWVGCAAAFDTRNQKVARAVATCLHAAGVTFAVLGQEESCTGDPARRMGNDYVFQMLAMGNVETLDKYAMGERTIVTACPHCFNSLVATSTASWAATTRSSTTPCSSSELVSSGRLATIPPDAAAGTDTGDHGLGTRDRPRLVLPGPLQRRGRGAARRPGRGRRRPSRRWPSPASRRSAAAPVAAGCGWRRTAGRGSTPSGRARSSRPARTSSRPRARSAWSCSATGSRPRPKAARRRHQRDPRGPDRGRDRGAGCRSSDGSAGRRAAAEQVRPEVAHPALRHRFCPRSSGERRLGGSSARRCRGSSVAMSRRCRATARSWSIAPVAPGRRRPWRHGGASAREGIGPPVPSAGATIASDRDPGPYRLTEDQLMLRDAVRVLADERIAPRAAEIDRTAEFPQDVRELLASHDILGLPFPEAHGGLGARPPDDLPGDRADQPRLRHVRAHPGRPGARRRCRCSSPARPSSRPAGSRGWRPGECLIAFALTEAEAGSDAAAIRTAAVRDGDDYVITGSKRFISQGSVADLITVFAVTDPEAPRNKRLSCFIVEVPTDGFSVSRIEHKMGIRGSPTAELAFDGVRVPAANRVGGGGRRLRARDADVRPEPARDRGAGRRDRPGRARGGDRVRQGAQAVRPADRRLPDGRARCSPTWTPRPKAARQLLYKACTEIEAGAPDASRWSAMCKLVAGDTAMRVTTDAVQVLGGYGYIDEFPVERMMRDAKITQLYEGTQQIQRLVIARDLLGKGS